MSASVYSLRRIEGLAPSDRRAVVLLECSQDKNIDAGKAFDQLNVKKDRELRNRFDFWISGGKNDKWFHGWPNSETYGECYVFKWKQHGIDHRIYGFLCHPIISKARFSVCVLISHATKSAWSTDSVILDRINRLRADSDVISAVCEAYQKDIPGVRP